MSDFESTDIRIDKIWRGPGLGNLVRITHLPSGCYVEKDVPAEEPLLKAVEELKKELQDKTNCEK